MELCIKALISITWIALGWVISGPVCLAQEPSASVEPPIVRSAETNVPPVFRFDPQPRGAARLDVAFVNAREAFLERLAAEYHKKTLTIVELSAPRFQQFVKACQDKDTSFPLTPELAVHWAAGQTGEAVLKAWARELTRKQFICVSNLPPAALGGSEVRMLTNSIDASVVADQGELIPRTNLSTLSQAREDLLNRFDPSQKEIANFLGGFLAENCSFDAQLTEQERAKREVPIVASSEASPPLAAAPEETAASEKQQELARASERIDAEIKAALQKLSELEARSASPLTSPPPTQDVLAVNPTNVIAAPVPLNSGTAVLPGSGLATGGRLGGASPAIQSLRPDQLFDLSGLMLVMSLMVLWLCLRFMSKREALAPDTRALSVFASAVAERDTHESISHARMALVPKFMEWLRSQGVQQLIGQREELLSTQQLAELELAKLEQMLGEVQAPIQERLRAYEERIAEMEDRLRMKGEENQEMIEAMVRLTRRKMESEQQAGSGGSWG